MRPVGHRDESFHGVHMRRDGLHQRKEAQVEAQHAVFGVVDDPAHLVLVQARV